MRQTGGKTKTQVARRSPILRWRTPPTLLSLSLSLPKCAPTWNQRQLSFLFYLFDRPLSTAAFGTIDETLFGTNQSTQRREIGQRGFRPVGSKNKGGDRERAGPVSVLIGLVCYCYITPNMALRSGSLKRKGMLETWSRLGISLGEAEPPTLPAPLVDPPGTATTDPDPLERSPVAPLHDDEFEAEHPVLVAAATAWAAAAAAATPLGSPFTSLTTSCCCCCCWPALSWCDRFNPKAAFNSACNTQIK